MFNKKVEKALNEQIVLESYASNSYMAMASWCEVNSLRGATGFYYEQSAEEREHMLKIVKYVNENGGQASIPAIKEPKGNFKSLEEVVDISLKQEKDVTTSIHKIVDLCNKEKDYGTLHFLQWFVEEQQEEENLFRSLQDMIHISGTKGASLIILDNEIAKIRNKE